MKYTYLVVAVAILITWFVLSLALSVTSPIGIIFIMIGLVVFGILLIVFGRRARKAGAVKRLK